VVRVVGSGGGGGGDSCGIGGVGGPHGTDGDEVGEDHHKQDEQVVVPDIAMPVVDGAGCASGLQTIPSKHVHQGRQGEDEEDVPGGSHPDPHLSGGTRQRRKFEDEDVSVEDDEAEAEDDADAEVEADGGIQLAPHLTVKPTGWELLQIKWVDKVK